MMMMVMTMTATVLLMVFRRAEHEFIFSQLLAAKVGVGLELKMISVNFTEELVQYTKLDRCKKENTHIFGFPKYDERVLVELNEAKSSSFRLRRQDKFVESLVR